MRDFSGSGVNMRVVRGGGEGMLSAGGVGVVGARRSSGFMVGGMHQAGQKLRWCGEEWRWARHLFVVGIARA